MATFPVGKAGAANAALFAIAMLATRSDRTLRPPPFWRSSQGQATTILTLGDHPPRWV